MTAGMCTNLDNPADRLMCGVGACMRDVQRCITGVLQTCTPGAPMVEMCNGADDNCNGTVDDGAASSCPSAPFAASYMCTPGGSCTFTCVSGRYDLNGTYGDGCECMDDTHGNACAGLSALGNVNPGNAISQNGIIVPDGEEDWFAVNFPNIARGPSNGNPQIRLTGSTASNFRLDVFQACGSAGTCGSGAPSDIGTWALLDNQSSGLNAYSGAHATPWPATVIFRVRRVTMTTLCADASYTVTISR
jgi:hypothetical protein